MNVHPSRLQVLHEGWDGASDLAQDFNRVHHLAVHRHISHCLEPDTCVDDFHVVRIADTFDEKFFHHDRRIRDQIDDGSGGTVEQNSLNAEITSQYAHFPGKDA